MGKSTDLADLGPIGIIRKSWEIFRKNPKTFLLIQFTFGLLNAILILSLEIVIHKHQKYCMRKLSQDPTSTHDMPVTSKPADVRDILMPLYGCFVPLQLIRAVILIFLQIIETLAISITTVVALGLVNNDENVSFYYAVKKAIPRLWKLLVWTLLCWQVLYQALYFGFLGLSYLIVYGMAGMISHVGILLLAVTYFCSVVVFMGIVLYLMTLFMVTCPVCVSEETRGWEALKMAKTLLHGKRFTGLCVQFLFYIPLGIAFWMIMWIEVAPKSLAVVVIVVAQIVILTSFSQLNYIAASVEYFSFKAYHRRSLPGWEGVPSSEGEELGRELPL